MFLRIYTLDDLFFGRFDDFSDNMLDDLEKTLFNAVVTQQALRLKLKNKSAPLEIILPHCVTLPRIICLYMNSPSESISTHFVTLPGFEGRKSKLVITIVRSRSPSCPRR